MEAAVLDVAAGVMTNEGHGLGETEPAVMVVRAGKGGRASKLACPDCRRAYLPALNQWLIGL